MIENRVETWHIVISGFTQAEGTLHGCERLELKTRSAAAPSVYVGLRTWKNNWRRLAEKISRTSAPRPRVYVYAYSWGAGHGFVTLAKELGKRGISVTHAVLCDPVYCSPWAAKVPGLRWLTRGIGVLRKAPIRIPRNVAAVDYFTQDISFPRGSHLEAIGLDTSIAYRGELPLPHSMADDADDWHEVCLQVAGVE